MSAEGSRFVVVASTVGSVMNQCLSNHYFRERVHSVFVDQPCCAADRAEEHGVPVAHLDAEDNDAFCARLLGYLVREPIDNVLSFYTRFYAKPLRDAYRDRIVNLHPSILPSFKGMDLSMPTPDGFFRYRLGPSDIDDEARQEAAQVEAVIEPVGKCGQEGLGVLAVLQRLEGAGQRRLEIAEHGVDLFEFLQVARLEGTDDLEVGLHNIRAKHLYSTFGFTAIEGFGDKQRMK